MSLYHFSKINLSKLILVFLLAALISACLTDKLFSEEADKDANQSADQTTAEKIAAPEITMDLPITLSGVLADAKDKTNSPMKVQGRNESNDLDQCEQYFDPNSNFLENGYNMSRFLVGLSQQQSCFADFIMQNIITQASIWLNQGVITLPVNPDDPKAPSHLQIEHSEGSYQAWLFFTTHGVDLPIDRSNLQTLYLSWSGTGEDIQGQFFLVNIALNENDPDAPTDVRVDFSRGASTATNQIYLNMPAGHSGGIAGFRIDVSQVGTGVNTIYSAKGLITFIAQPFADLPEGLELPIFSVAAILDASGLGATSANFSKFAVTLNNDSNKDGSIDPVQNEFDLGSYQFDINDITYFDPIRYDPSNTQTTYVKQVTEWRNKSVNNASYVADYTRIEPTVPQGLENYTQLKCLERDFCDYNGNGYLDESSGEWLGWSLGLDYFTTTCIDNAATINNDCDAFVGKIFEDSLFGVFSLNSSNPEPADWRNTELAGLTQLTSVHPDSATTGTFTFVIPKTPATPSFNPSIL